MMINPSIEQLTKGEFNRYALVIATAKCAKVVTDDYVAQREQAEKMIADKKTEKSLASLIDIDIRDKKAVENAVQRLYRGDFNIIFPEETNTEQLK
ncbi:MAG: DNA-directed RNA polymerase subunit omega [Clostridia bacterium]|nr:DNA-directed RNA polymerase subunit omega [Clostridia bacterium]